MNASFFPWRSARRVETGIVKDRFNGQVRRNAKRSPSDFQFQLIAEETQSLRSQNAILKTGRGKHRKYALLVFSEHGAIMAATILNSPKAVQMSVYVVRAFVRLRQVLASNNELARRLKSLERSLAALDVDTRKQFDQVYEAILGLTRSPPRKS